MLEIWVPFANGSFRMVSNDELIRCSPLTGAERSVKVSKRLPCCSVPPFPVVVE